MEPLFSYNINAVTQHDGTNRFENGNWCGWGRTDTYQIVHVQVTFFVNAPGTGLRVVARVVLDGRQVSVVLQTHFPQHSRGHFERMWRTTMEQTLLNGHMFGGGNGTGKRAFAEPSDRKTRRTITGIWRGEPLERENVTGPCCGVFACPRRNGRKLFYHA